MNLFPHPARVRILRACWGLVLLTACTVRSPVPPTPIPSLTLTTPPPTNSPTIPPAPTFTMTPKPSSTPTPTETFIPTETLTPFPTNPAPDPSGMWFPEPPMLFARAAHAVVSTGSALFTLAGTGADRRPVMEVERFDGTTWTIETTLPTEEGLNAPAAVFLDGRIYLIGGFEATSNQPVADMYVYDLTTRTWSNAAPLPNPRGGHAAVILDGEIHIVGGGNSQRTLADHSVYDPTTNTWTELAPLPDAKGSPAAVVFDGKLYVIGGRSGPHDFANVDIYNVTTNTWETGPSIDPRGTAGVVAYCNTLYVFGGESQARKTSLNEVLRLNLAHLVWELAPAMPTARVYARAVLLNESVYVVGGSPNPVTSHASPGLDVVERYHSDCTE
ncbi:MAG: hypothetical protein H6636_07810 [Anaerolineales bacterium]|nr:hypothetical protein [Anaerolineales bacterium]